jgi:hypothetical protein
MMGRVPDSTLASLAWASMLVWTAERDALGFDRPGMRGLPARVWGVRAAPTGRDADVDERIVWPDGKTFAFTVFDDTDNATLENVPPIYDLLSDLGMRTTKSVWPVRGPEVPRIGGTTSDDPDYRAWTLRLQAQGFEIGSHGATYHTADRSLVIEATERFRALYGHYPKTLANHSGCAESIYWGADRVTGIARLAYNLMTGFRSNGAFRGHREGDPLFWGDVCRDRVRYVRNFTFTDIDTLGACPLMPYHDPERPFVNAWFASSEGASVRTFNDCIAEAHQDRLEARGGACIMYTHFASGFWSEGRLDRRFVTLMERLARKNGWFVPVATLLDYLADRRGVTTLRTPDRRRLEMRWLASKIRAGHT